jgi:PHD/YefM family antitoxin component YafN of YafNO toxin-antitoxin module
MNTAATSDHELAIRLKEPLRDDKLGEAQADRRSSISPEESKILDQAREQVVQTRQPQGVTITISRSQYELFKKELADLGNIERESSTSERKNEAAANSSDQLRIKLTILPPLSSMPLPSQPASR